MKRIITTLFSIISTQLAISQSSTITGTVLVTYNYVNTGADAGAEVRLWNSDKSYKDQYGLVQRDSVILTRCGVDGNFTIKNVPAGNYILYVSSKSAIADPYNIYSSLTSTLSKPIKTMTGFDIDTHKPELKKTIEDLLAEALKYGEEKKFKKYEKSIKEMNEKINDFISSFPGDVLLFLNFFNGRTTSKEFKVISIKQGVDENYSIKFDAKF